MLAILKTFAVVTVLLGQGGPPPPEVRVVRLYAEDLAPDARAASDALLETLEERGYLLVRPSALSAEAFERCWTQRAATESCLSRRLGEEDAGPGEVVVAAWSDAGGTLHWICSGRNRGDFSPAHQAVVLPGSTGQWSPDVLQRASSCLTYAGLQSGW